MLGVTAVVVAIVTTLIAALLHSISYGHHRKQAIRFWERELKLPDATRYDNLKLRNEEAQAELDRIQDQLFDSRQIIDEAARQKQWMEETKEEVARLDQERDELVRIQTELETVQTQLAELSQLRVEMEARIAELKDQSLEVERAHAELESQVKELEEKQRLAANVEEELADLITEYNEEEAKLEKLKKKADEIRERLQTELRDLKKQGETTKLEFDELAKEKDSLEDEIAKLGSEQKQLESSCDRLENQVKDLESKKQEVDSLEDELLKLKENTKSEKAELEDLIRQVDGHQDQLDRLKEQRDSVVNEVDKLAQRESQLRNEVSGLEAKSNALSNQMPILQSAFESLSEHLNPGSSSKDSEASDIWQPVLVAPTSKMQNSPTELDALSVLRHHMESLGLKFHQRTINSFHTALKTTDSSPLVVLAGVSGTGKSELPRRYSQAMGFNFLNMAVQPRWDSPQDLFGFYDYLERKFRPTELTRALIQMDGFRNQGDRGWRPPRGFANDSRSDGLLLVLLDEMNLARVEYYFSEFLSRLETRRGIDVNNDAQRRQAEIVLEVSGRQSGEKPMQLFADKNVMFVGTMNEDETTQSLSDKVIDRANVLRFGSPASVDDVYTKQKRNGKPVPTDWRLSKDHWLSWQKDHHDLNDGDRKQMLGWISELRTSLDRVRRPFAYRVAQSMLEYAANYPAVEDKLAIVIADQIEQKVLPRLRGLDPHDPDAQAVFNTLFKILDETEDEVLLNAIKECSRDHYFQWGGLDRYEERAVR